MCILANLLTIDLSLTYILIVWLYKDFVLGKIFGLAYVTTPKTADNELLLLF